MHLRRILMNEGALIESNDADQTAPTEPEPEPAEGPPRQAKPHVSALNNLLARAASMHGEGGLFIDPQKKDTLMARQPARETAMKRRARAANRAPDPSMERTMRLAEAARATAGIGPSDARPPLHMDDVLRLSHSHLLPTSRGGL